MRYGLVGLVALVVAGCQTPSTSSVGTVRASRLEIVDKDGAVVAVVEARREGGGANLYLGSDEKKALDKKDPHGIIINAGAKGNAIAIGGDRDGVTVSDSLGVVVTKNGKDSYFPEP